MPVRKSRVTDLEIVLKDFEPRKIANGQLRMMCPFRENHTDGSGEMSFFVSPDINAYHCFSCKAHGNLVKFLVTQGVNYFEAVGMVKLTDHVAKKEEFDLDIHWTIQPPREFIKRGFSRETLKHFKLGVIDDGWMVIPFYKSFHKASELVGYQRRIENPDRVVINNKGFNKAEYLYNLDTSYDYVIVVEGYSDAMRLYQHGYNATAVLGADVSKWQANEIGKFRHVYAAFDNDKAGRRATEILYHQIKNATEVKMIPYLTKDPGNCISKRNWEIAFENSTDYIIYSMEMSIGQDDYLEMKEQVLKDLKHRL